MANAVVVEHAPAFDDRRIIAAIDCAGGSLQQAVEGQLARWADIPRRAKSLIVHLAPAQLARRTWATIGMVACRLSHAGALLVRVLAGAGRSRSRLRLFYH